MTEPPHTLHRQINDSLRRLRTDRIDLYYLHRTDDNVPLDDSWGALSDAVTAGKIRWLGLSEVTIAQAARAHRLHTVTAIQSELSLWTRGPLGSPHRQADSTIDDIDGDRARSGGAAATTDEPIVHWSADNAISFLPFAPLGRGFLTGSISDATHFDSTDFRADNPRFQADAMTRNKVITDTTRDIAARHNATPAQIALAWVLAQSDNIIPIPGTRSRAHLNDNLAASTLLLTSTDLEQLAAR